MSGASGPRSRTGPIVSLAVVLGGCMALLLRGCAAALAPGGRVGPRFAAAAPALAAVFAGGAVLAAAAFIRGRRAVARGEGVRPGILLRRAFVAAVLFWAAFVAFVQPYWGLYLDLGAAGAAGVVVLLLFPGPGLARRLPRRLLRAFELLLFDACLAAVLLEAGLRTWAVLDPSPLFARAAAAVEDTLVRHRFRPGQPVLGVRCDERGYADDPPRPRAPGESLVALVGDSFAVGIVPRPFHLSSVAERAFAGVQVYCLGVNRAGPAEYRWILEHDALPLRPDLVVISVFAGNDLLDATHGRRARGFAASVFDRDNVLLWQVPRRLAVLARERRDRGGSRPPGVVQGEDLAAPSDTDPDSWRRSHPWLFDPALEEPTFSREAFLDMEDDRVLGNCGADLRRYPSLFDDLRAMKALCGATPLKVLLIPDEFQVEDGLWNELTSRHPGLPLDRDQPQRLIIAWLAAEGIPVLDLLPILRDVPPLADGQRHLYHLQDSHFNARGNEAAGAALARFLRP